MGGGTGAELTVLHELCSGVSEEKEKRSSRVIWWWWESEVTLETVAGLMVNGAAGSTASSLIPSVKP